MVSSSRFAAVAAAVLVLAVTATAYPARSQDPKTGTVTVAGVGNYVRTPVGYVREDCVREVPNGVHIEERDADMLLTHADGRQSTMPYCDTKNGARPAFLEHVPGPLPPDYDGWEEYTSVENSDGYDTFLGYFSVPDKPAADPQVLYLFTGLQVRADSCLTGSCSVLTTQRCRMVLRAEHQLDPQGHAASHYSFRHHPACAAVPRCEVLLAAVLMLLLACAAVVSPYESPHAGLYAASFGNEWSVKSWWVTLNGGAMFSTELPVNSGDKIFGNMTRVGSQSYYIGSVIASSGKVTGITYTNSRLQSQPWAYNTLECVAPTSVLGVHVLLAHC